jgi:hypothetical protein
MHPSERHGQSNVVNSSSLIREDNLGGAFCLVVQLKRWGGFHETVGGFFSNRFRLPFAPYAYIRTGTALLW